MSTTRARRLANQLAAMAILVGAAWWIYYWTTAEPRVRSICQQMSPGMRAADVEALAAKYGLGPGQQVKPSGTSHLVESKTFGRHGCRIEMSKGFVESATYDHAS